MAIVRESFSFIYRMESFFLTDFYKLFVIVERISFSFNLFITSKNQRHRYHHQYPTCSHEPGRKTQYTRTPCMSR